MWKAPSTRSAKDKSAVSIPSPLVYACWFGSGSAITRSEQNRQKKKANELNGALHVRFTKDVTIFHFDPTETVQCNFFFPDGRRQQHQGEERETDQGLLEAHDIELVRVYIPHPWGPAWGCCSWWVRLPSRRGGGSSGGMPRSCGCREAFTVRPSLLPPLPAAPLWMHWGGCGKPLRWAPLVGSWPPRSLAAAPLGPWAGSAVAPGGWLRPGGRARLWEGLGEDDKDYEVVDDEVVVKKKYTKLMW